MIFNATTPQKENPSVNPSNIDDELQILPNETTLTLETGIKIQKNNQNKHYHKNYPLQKKPKN